MATAGVSRLYLFTQGLSIFVLLMVLYQGLLPALLAGLLIYQLVDFGSRTLERVGLSRLPGKIVLLLFLSSIVILSLWLGLAAASSNISDGPDSFVILMQRMADVVSAGRNYLPLWIQSYLPSNIEEWQAILSNWLRENAKHVSLIGLDVGIFLGHILIGMILGGLVAMNPSLQGSVRPPLAHEIAERVGFVSSAFRRIVFSQIRISALNTVLTAVFLGGIMPLLMGTALPLVKTMIVVTFIAGLLPIIGNLVSNTVIFLICLSVSPVAAVSALIFLVVIHKLEYFINAQIIGSRIRAKSWEILISMVVMESLFGIAGVVAAPIYYAYLKEELNAKKLI